MSTIQILHRVKSEIQGLLNTSWTIELNDLTENFKLKQHSINERFKLHLTNILNRLNKLDADNYKQYVINPDKLIEANISDLNAAYSLVNKLYVDVVLLKSYRSDNDIEILNSNLTKILLLLASYKDNHKNDITQIVIGYQFGVICRFYNEQKRYSK